MKKLTLFIIVCINLNRMVLAQPCTAASTPRLGNDTTVIIKCINEITDLRTLYTTAGLNTQWDVLNPAIAKMGYHHLIVTNGQGCKDTAYITIKQDIEKWVGSISSDWHNPANWSGNRVPTAFTHVIIAADIYNPCTVSSADAVAASVRLLKNAHYEIAADKKITATGTCDSLPPYYELSANAVLIDNATSHTIQSVDSAQIIFNGSTTQLQNLASPGIILSGIAPNAPFGFLRQITGIQHNGTVYTVTTTDIPLESAFKELHVLTTKTFTAADTLQHRPSGTAGTSGALTFSFPLVNIELDPGLTINGNLDVTPGLNATIDITNNQLNYAKIEGSFQRVLTLGIEANSNLLNFSGKKDLINANLEVIVAGPVIIVPALRITLGAEASSDVKMSASATNTSTVGEHLEYKNFAWNTGADKTTETTYDFSGVQGNANVKVYVEPAIDFKLYNQDWAKGTLSAEAYLKAQGQFPPAPPHCDLSWGLKAGANVNLKFFSAAFSASIYPDLLSYEKSLFKCRLPKVTTTPVTNASYYTANGGGNVTDSGQAGIQLKGVCFSKTHNPTFNDGKTSDGAGTGIFTSSLTGLEQNTVYFARAYVINNTGDTAYGQEVTFTTRKDSANLIKSYTYAFYRWRYGAIIPGLVNMQSPENPPAYSFEPVMDYIFNEATTFSVYHYDSPNVPASGAFSYSVGSYSPDSLFLSFNPLDSTGYQHHYAEGWGFKLPPGYNVQLIDDPWPSRLTPDLQFIYRGFGGDMVFRRK